MTPEELAALHPRLYHVTSPEASRGIRRHGLLPTEQLVSLFDVPEPMRAIILRQRRRDSVLLLHSKYGEATITDNYPLNEAKLAACLDGGLTPAEWLAMLNKRVFFWPDDQSVATLLNAKLNRDRNRLVLEFDTLSMARTYGSRIEISPINSGSTLYQPARRGPSTFSPLFKYDYATWRRLRGKSKPDVIKEVTVLGGLDRVDDHLVREYIVPGRTD